MTDKMTEGNAVASVVPAESDAIRSQVSDAYARALERSRAGGSGCCAVPAGTAAKLAGYEEELAAHGEAGRSSFGCGNPLAFAEVQPGQTVLDLGSGAGLDLLIAAERVGPTGKVIGVDMTDEMIDAARANVARAGAGQVEVRKGVIEALPVQSESVDWVISNCVVNLSPQKELVFGEIHRVLKPGGRFSISDIVVDDLPEDLRRSASAYASCVAGAISEAEYIAGLRRAGLTDVRVSERLVYEPEQVVALIAGSADDPVRTDAGCCTLELSGSAGGIEGKVASVRLSGRRP